MTILIALETALLVLLTILVAGLLRAYASVLRRLHRLDGGADAGVDVPRQFSLPAVEPRPAGPDQEFGSAHDLAGKTLAGEIVSARVVDVAHDTVLLFLSSGCASCAVFWDELSRPVPLPAGTRLVVVPQEEEDRATLASLAPAGVDVVLSSAAWTEYEVPGSPYVIFVDGASGRIRGEGTGQSLRQVAELLARSTGKPAFLGITPSGTKPARDASQEASVDRELLAAGILPGDPRLYGSDP